MTIVMYRRRRSNNVNRNASILRAALTPAMHAAAVILAALALAEGTILLAGEDDLFGYERNWTEEYQG